MEASEKFDEVSNQKWKRLELERQKFSLYQTLYTVIEEILDSPGKLKEDIRDKIQYIILSSSCMQHIIGESALILGVTIDKNLHLNRIETNNLSTVLEQVLNDKYKSLCVVESEFDIKNKNVNRNSNETVDILSSKQNIFVEYILKLADVVTELKEIKTIQLPQVLENKLNECNLISRVKSLQAQMAEEKFRVDIFTEVEEALEAYKEIIKTIKQQTDDCLRDVEDLSKLKLKYDDVTCKEYEEILVSYLKLKLELEDFS